MKNMSVIFLSLFALTFGLCGNAMAAPLLTQKSVNMYGTASTVEDVAEVVITCTNESTDECVDKTGSTAFKIAGGAVAVPVATAIASSAGVAASTGTAISALSGAAATTATTYTVGSAVVSATGGAAAIVAAPAVIGAAVIVGAGAAVGGLIWWCFN